MEAHRVVEVKTHELLTVGKDHLREVSEVLHYFPVELQHLHTRDTQLVSFSPLLFQIGTPLPVLASDSWYMRQYILCARICNSVAPEAQETSLVVVLAIQKAAFLQGLFKACLEGCAISPAH